MALAAFSALYFYLLLLLLPLLATTAPVKTAFVHTKISRIFGTSGIHTGIKCFGEMEGDASVKNITRVDKKSIDG